MKRIRWDGNEIILTDDMENSQIYNVQNFDDALGLIGATTIMNGLTVTQAVTPDMTVLIPIGIAYDLAVENLLVSNSQIVGTIPAADPTQARRDIIEIKRLENPTALASRQFKNPSTGVVTTSAINTEVEYNIEVKVLSGTPGGSAPSVETGYMKIAEILVPAASTTVIDANIYNCDADQVGATNTNWTTDTNTTYRNGSISDINTFMRKEASTSQQGMVQLNDANISTSITEASTPNALKKVNDILSGIVCRNWTSITIANGNFFSVCFSESLGRFVAVGLGSTNNVAYSSDGISWTSITIADGDLDAVCFSESLGRFVAVGTAATNNVAYSSDGVSWTSITIADGDLYGVCFSESLGRFVAVGHNATNNVAYSSDGISWTSITIADGSLSDVAFSESLGRFVAVGYAATNNVAYSSDGINWTSITNDDGDSLARVTFSENLGRFVATGTYTTNNISYSSDGISWTSITIADGSLRGVCFSETLGRFVVVSPTVPNNIYCTL